MNQVENTLLRTFLKGVTQEADVIVANILVILIHLTEDALPFG